MGRQDNDASGWGVTRGKQVSTLAVMARDLLVADDTRRKLDGAAKEMAGKPDDAVEQVMIAQAREAIDYHLAIPASLLQRRTELGSIGQVVWAKARAENDFASFAPILEQTVALNREMADVIGYAEHPYDALMFRFEPGETVATLKPLFQRLRDGLLPLVRAIAEKPQPRFDFLERHYPVDKQHQFALKMAETVGYDLNRGRLDTTVHPFEVSFTAMTCGLPPASIRITCPPACSARCTRRATASMSRAWTMPIRAPRSRPISSASMRWVASASAPMKASHGSGKTMSAAPGPSGTSTSPPLRRFIPSSSAT